MMDYLGEKVAYLKGLAEGLKIDENTSEGKLLKEIVNILSDFADVIDDLDDSHMQLSEHVEEMDEDLARLEYEVYDDEDNDIIDYDYDEDDYMEADYYEIQCPSCHETVYLDEELFEDDDEIICPNCKEPIEIEFECGCCHEYDEENDDEDDE